MVDNNPQKWPEKFDINKLVTRQSDISKIIKGDKTSERRNDRYADPGDELVLNGHAFVVANVYPQKLKTITGQHAREEGYKGLDDYKEALTAIHHGTVWDPEQVVWAHELTEKQMH